MNTGIFNGYPERDYRKDPRLNKSYLNNFCKGNAPRQALYQKDSGSLGLGRQIHSYIESGLKEFAISPYDNFRTKDAREWKKDQEDNGRSVITSEDVEVFDTIKAEVHKITHNNGTDIELGSHEVTCFTDTEKCRLDFLNKHGDVIIDWKSCQSADPRSIDKAIYQYNYDLQAFFYKKVYEELSGQTCRFDFVFFEMKAPYSTTYVQLSDTALALGEAKYIYATERLNTLKKLDNMGASYVDEAHTYEPADWAMTEYGLIGDNNERTFN